MNNKKPSFLQCFAVTMGMGLLFNGPIRIFLLGYVDFTSVLLIAGGAGWFLSAILSDSATRQSLFGMRYEPDKESI